MTEPTKRQLRRRIDDLDSGANGDGPIPTPTISKAEKETLAATFDPAKETPAEYEGWLTETYGLSGVDKGDLP